VYDTKPHENINVWGPATESRNRTNRNDQDDVKKLFNEIGAALDDEAPQRRAALTEIKVSPRQAEALTWKEGLAEAGNDNMRIAPMIYFRLGRGITDDPTVPTWWVRYVPVLPDGPPGLLDLGWPYDKSSEFVLDATTGEITAVDTTSED
jgi:hypothetical protein